MRFLPLALDGVFLRKSPEEIVAGKEFNAVPFMIGVTNNEFGWNIRSLLIQRMLIFLFLLSVIMDGCLGDTDDPAELWDRFLDLLGDSRAPTYYFEYQHWPALYWDTKPEYVKADHGDEVSFVFGGPYLAGDICLCEKNLSRTLMKYWANFAGNGNPNGEGLVEWPSYNLNEEYLEINLKQKKARKLKEKKVDFWRRVIFEVINNERTENKKVNSEL
uniref:Carboxylesterase type B domain-containing protein n=1 Tax=Dromaius novaehollandiae TaxID=8790 RepID=A0A8C4P9M6_DRONO